MSIFERFFGGPKPEEDKSEVVLANETEQEELPPFDESNSGDGVPEEAPTMFHDFEKVIRENPELGQKSENDDVGKAE